MLASSTPAAEGAFPGRSGRIAIAETQGDNNNNYPITSVTATGRRPRVISGDGAAPAYSPRGRWVAYGAQFSDGIWVRRASGRGRARQVTAGDSDTDPDWSPSGRRLVFSRERHAEIWIHEGGRSRRLTEGSDPAWSTRGEIAFVRQDGLYAIRPDGTGLRRIVATMGEDPDWSPDGRRIVFVANRPGGFYGDGRIESVRADGSGLRRLTRGTTDASPSFSPDSKKIAFLRGYGSEDLIVMRPTGRHPQTILSDAWEDATGTDWQPLPRRRARPTNISAPFAA